MQAEAAADSPVRISQLDLHLNGVSDILLKVDGVPFPEFLQVLLVYSLLGRVNISLASGKIWGTR